MKPTTCARLRQGDEWYCSLCHTRWEHGENAPPCAPIENPIEINAPKMGKTRFRNRQKRAKRFQGWR